MTDSERDIDTVHSYVRSMDRMGRIFPLEPLRTSAYELAALGACKGPMDGGERGRRTQTVDLGQVLFAQFLAHEIALDLRSGPAGVSAPEPRLDLNSIYQPRDGNKADLGVNGKFADPQSEPLVHSMAAQSAEEEAELSGLSALAHLDDLVVQICAAMKQFHNHVVDQIGMSEGLTGGALLGRAKHLVSWHYQWLIVNDFLPTLCGQPVVDDVMNNGCRFYCPVEAPFIPIEFAEAARYFVHSMVPEDLPIKRRRADLAEWKNTDALLHQDMLDWHVLLTTKENRSVRKADKLNSRIASSLLEPVEGGCSLASRKLLRGQAFKLPSGEQVAHAMGRSQLEINKLSAAAQTAAGESTDLFYGTPLWFYLLIEAENIGRETQSGDFDPGEGLGPIGGRIMTETLLGFLERDESSYLQMNPSWTPAAESLGVGSLGEMLTF